MFFFLKILPKKFEIRCLPSYFLPLEPHPAEWQTKEALAPKTCFLPHSAKTPLWGMVSVCNSWTEGSFTKHFFLQVFSLKHYSLSKNQPCYGGWSVCAIARLDKTFLSSSFLFKTFKFLVKNVTQQKDCYGGWSVCAVAGLEGVSQVTLNISFKFLVQDIRVWSLKHYSA